MSPTTGTGDRADALDFRRVIEAFSDAVIAADEGGSIVFANSQAERLLGWPPAELRGRPLVTLIPARFHEAHYKGFARYLDTRAPQVIGQALRLPVLHRDGSEIVIELTLSTIPGLAGQELFVAALRDVRERLELERENEVTRRLLGVLANASTLGMGIHGMLQALGEGLGWELALLWVPEEGDGALVCTEVWHDPGLRLDHFVAASRALRCRKGEGLPGEVFESSEPVWLPVLEDEPNFPRLEAARADGLAGGFAFPLRMGDRRVGVIELFSRAPRVRDPQLLETLGTIGEPLAQFMDNRRAWQEVDANRHRLALALEAARMGTWEWDAATNIMRFSTTAREILGFDLATFDGAPNELFSNVHPDDRERVERAVTASLLSGESLWIEHRVLPGHGPRWVETRGRVGRAAGGTVRGMTGVVIDVTARKLAEMERDRLLREREHTVDVLQSSLLPGRLPEIEGFDIHAGYRAAGRGEVGGDFYDVFPIGEEAWGFLMGDVCGKGPRAAAVTAMARYTLRAAALHIRAPSRVLGELNAAMLRQEDDTDGRFCTLAFARVHRQDGRALARISVGGHPTPLIARRNGDVEPVDCEGFLVGLLPEAEYGECDIELEPGDAVVLYTDGVTEARSGAELFGEERLRTVLSALAGRSAREMVEGVETEVYGFQDQPRDDLAVLVVRFDP